MDSLKAITEGNRELSAMLNRLIEVATAVPLNLKAVADGRHEMSKRISSLLAEKDLRMMAVLRSSDDAAHRDLTRRYTNELLRSRDEASAYNARWSIRTIEADPREYRLTLRAQARRMQVQFKWEANELLPAAARVLEARTGNRRVA